MVTLHRGDELGEGFLSEPIPLQSGHAHRTKDRLDRRQLDNVLAFADSDRTVSLKPQILLGGLHAEAVIDH